MSIKKDVFTEKKLKFHDCTDTPLQRKTKKYSHEYVRSISDFVPRKSATDPVDAGTKPVKATDEVCGQKLQAPDAAAG